MSTLLSLALLTIGSGEALTFEATLALADAAPGVRVAAVERQSREQADAQLSSLSHSPSIGLSPGWRLSPGEDRGPEIIGTVQQSWSLGGLAGARQDAASEERVALAMGERARRLEARLDAAGAWIELWSREQELALVEEELRLARALAERTGHAAEAKLLTADDQAEAASYAAEAQLAALEVEGARVVAEVRLKIALGRRAGEPLATQGPPPQVELPPASEHPRLLALADHLPGPVHTRLLALAARARRVEVEAAGASTLTTGLTFQRESPTSWLSYLNLGLTLPLFEHGQREVAQAEGNASAAAARADADGNLAGHHLALALHEVEHSAEQETTLREHLRPELARIVEFRRRALGSGEGTLLALLTAQRRLLQVDRQLRRQQADRHWAAIKLWLLLHELRSENQS